MVGGWRLMARYDSGVRYDSGARYDEGRPRQRKETVVSVLDILDEIGDAIDTIEGIDVYRYPASTWAPPAAVIYLPDPALYQMTYRGGAKLELQVVVDVGGQDDIDRMRNLSPLISRGNEFSIADAIERFEYTAADWAVVGQASYEDVSAAGADIGLVAVFDVTAARIGSAKALSV